MPSPEASRQGRRNRRHGAKKERDTLAWLRARGWLAIGNTHGPFDIMASKQDEKPRIIEVKSGKRPYDNFPPKERAATAAAAKQGGVDAYLAHWKPYAREPDLIHSDDWPTRNGGTREQ